jgi:hypothetical protein
MCEMCVWELAGGVKLWNGDGKKGRMWEDGAEVGIWGLERGI